MPHVLIVLVVLAIVFWGSGFFKGLTPGAKDRLMRTVCVYGSLGAAVFLLLRGQGEVALGLGGLGLYLLGFSAAPHWSGLFRNAGRPPSELRAAIVEMAPDFASGLVLAGAFEGRRMEDLSRAECEALCREARSSDPNGAKLIEFYLDRRFPGWRAAGERDFNARGRARSGGKMSEDEAYETLGLEKGASSADIANAHRSLMKKLHPDQGGTTALAARVNEARDILTRRHL